LPPVRAGLVGVAALLLLVAGVSPAAAAETAWAVDGFGPANTGYNPDEQSINESTLQGLAYRWSITSPVVFDSCSAQRPPLIAGGRLYIPDQGGVAAYEA